MEENQPRPLDASMIGKRVRMQHWPSEKWFLVERLDMGGGAWLGKTKRVDGDAYDDKWSGKDPMWMLLPPEQQPWIGGPLTQDAIGKKVRLSMWGEGVWFQPESLVDDHAFGLHRGSDGGGEMIETRCCFLANHDWRPYTEEQGMNLTTEHLGKRMTRQGWDREAWFIPERMEGDMVYGINHAPNGAMRETNFALEGRPWALWEKDLPVPALEQVTTDFGCHADKVRALLTAWEAHLVDKYDLSESD